MADPDNKESLNSVIHSAYYLPGPNAPDNSIVDLRLNQFPNLAILL